MPKPADPSTPYVPGLDGLRALAVLAVLGYHLGLDHLAGGLLGVGVFFTLSGFLITSILLQSWERTGTLELKRFWLHRARRLLPAVVVMLAVVLAWTALTEPDVLAERWGESWSALLYVANWHTILAGQSYFDRFAAPGPLEHLWSLSVEEQFYVLWPIVLLVALRYRHLTRRAILALTALLTAASFTLLAVLASPGFDNTRAYEGTDTRAGGILVGALLALCWPRVRRVVERAPALRGGMELVGLAGLAGIGWLVVSTDDYSMQLYSYGLLLLSLSTAALVAAVMTPDTWVGWVLGQEPLRWLGERSYGIYLWQLPVIASVSTTALADQPWLWGLTLTALTLGLAELSWRLVEDPIRTHGLRGALQHARDRVVRDGAGERTMARVPLIPAGAVALTLVATSAMIATTFADPHHDDQVAMLTQADGGRPPIPDDVGTARSARDRGEAGDRRNGGRPNGPAQTSCRGVAYLGESTSIGLMDPSYLPDPADRLPAQLELHGVQRLRTDILGARSIVERWHDQPNAQEGAEAIEESGFAGCWIIAMGTNDSANQAVGGVYPYPERIDLLMKQIGDAPVMWLTVKSLNSSGPYADANMASFDSALEDACSRYPNLRLYDWRSEVQDPWFISDGIHFTSAGYQQRAKRIGDALARAFPADGDSSADGCTVSSGLR